MDTLRKIDGLAGFPKSTESEYDCFNTGHSSTSISAALGMARARDIRGEKNYIIAVIGDGALTGGMALEALNDAGCSNTNLIVILNDNEMSIGKNVGGISQFLTKIRTRKLYNQSNQYVKRTISQIPKIGNKIIKFVRRIKYSLKQLMIPNMLFEDIGFKYLGPVNGHNIEDIEAILKKAKDLQGPILIHVLTKKGKGYGPAEKNPDKFHGASSFDIATGKSKKIKMNDYSKIFGEKLVKLAEKNEEIVAITAAMTAGTGLMEFANRFPDRFFDVGIAEQHALTMAAGMAKSGLKPFISIYSSFYQRGYDQIIHDICLQNLPVVMCIDRAGIVGNDGETHQGLLDLAFLRIVPNITIMAPKDFKELEQMLEFASDFELPIAIRYPRGGEANVKFEKHSEIELGKAEYICKVEEKELANTQKMITIISIGKMTARAVEISEKLNGAGIKTEIINSRFLKPFDTKAVIDSITKTKNCITIEDGYIKGGLASTVQELIVDKHLVDVKFRTFGYPDEYIKHGNVDELEKLYGLDKDSIASSIINEMMREEDE